MNVPAMLRLVDVAIGTEEEFNAAMARDCSDIVVRDQRISAPEIRGNLDENLKVILSLAAGSQALVVKRGDAFAASFIHGRLQGSDGHRAARMASTHADRHGGP